LLFTGRALVYRVYIMADAQLQKIRKNLLAIKSGATPAQMSERIRDLCNVNGYDPVYELMDLVRKGARVTQKDAEGNEHTAYVPLDTKEQIAIHKEMIRYIYPQLKAVDIQNHIDANITINVKNFGDSEVSDAMKEAIDADFSEVSEAITKNVAKIKEKNKQNA
jgi:hypothetical protein